VCDDICGRGVPQWLTAKPLETGLIFVLSERVAAMKRRSGAGGNPAKARPSKLLKLKRRIVPKAVAGRSSAMQQIADWLEKLGMSEYAQRFVENDVDISVLRHLTDQDLKELGVSLGHRRRMLAVISQLSGAPHSPHEPAGHPGPKQGGAAPTQSLARKLLRTLRSSHPLLELASKR
jgi:SAM domain (Sterile alpha motif)